jgi:hypothetical protein
MLFGLALALTSCASGGGRAPAAPGGTGAPESGAAPMSVTFMKAGRKAPGPVSLAELGMVVGASYEEKLGRLFIVGNGVDVEASPTEQQLAVALSRASGERVRPWVSIDPVPNDPAGPWMNIATSKDVANTDFGWVMLEADRRLKSYALGYDSVSGEVTTASVPGFSNRLQLGRARGSEGDSGFQRFWLRPSDINEALESSAGIRIGAGGIIVATEGQAFVDGKLVDAKERRDPLAAEFAGFVSKHYPELARDEPSFKRLEQLRRLAVIGEWTRKRRIPVGLDWIVRNMRLDFALPTKTPTLRVAATQSSRTVSNEAGGTRIVERRTELGAVGGASFQELAVQFVPVAAPDYERLPPDVAAATPPGRATRFDAAGKQLVAFAVAVRGGAVESAPLEPLFRVKLASGEAVLHARSATATDHPARPALDRVVALPVLRSSNPSDGGVEIRAVAGAPDSRVVVRAYELYGADGTLVESFEEHAIDQQRGRIVVLPKSPGSRRRLYPHGTRRGADGVEQALGATIVGFEDGVTRTFDVATGVLVAEEFPNERLEYEYNEHLLPTALHLARGKEPSSKVVDFSHEANGSVVVAATYPVEKKTVSLSPSLGKPVPEAVGNATIAPAELALSERDSNIAPVLLPLGGYTLLFHEGKATPLLGSVRSPRSLLAIARERLEATSGAEIVDIQPIDATRAGVLTRRGDELHYDEIGDYVPRRRRSGASALLAYHELLGARVAHAASTGAHFVYWARHGNGLRVWSGDRVLDLPVKALEAPTAEQLARILGSARGPVFLLHQGIELSPNSKPLAVALSARAAAAERKLYLARDVELALHNHRRLGHVKKAADVTLSVFDNFHSARILRPMLEKLERRGARYVAPESLDIDASLRGNDGARPTLIVYAHNDASYQDWLKAAAEKGKLTNRSVLAVTCHAEQNGAKLSALLASSGAVAFANTLEKVDPTVLPAVTTELDGLLSDLEASNLEGDSLLGEAVERALLNPANQNDQALLAELRALLARLFIQLSLTPERTKEHRG